MNYLCFVYVLFKFTLFLTFFTDYSLDDHDDYAGMIEIEFNLDDYLKREDDESSSLET